MEGRLIVSNQESQRAAVLEQVCCQSLTLKEASSLLNVSYRQAKRLLCRYREHGLAGLLHRGRGRPAPNTLAPELQEVVLELRRTKYKLFNDTHFTEMLAEVEGIVVSRETVRKLRRRDGHPPKRKRRPPAHRSRRPRRPSPGLLVQWDGSPHHWFGPERPACCLMAALDDATGDMLAALFIPAESALGYLRLLDMILRLHGVPAAIYHDRHSALVRTDDHWSLEEQLAGERYPTHVGRVLQELGIESICAYSPQAKGRIERGYGTLQDRLIAEMALAGITGIEAANPWLEAVFIPRFNTRFAKPAAQPESAFRRISDQDRYLALAFAYVATVGNDNCVRLGGLILDVPPGRQRRSYAKAKVLVRQHLDGAWTIWYQDRKIAALPPTELTEPIRSWARRGRQNTKAAKQMIQVYISSKPAPSAKGTFLLGS